MQLVFVAANSARLSIKTQDGSLLTASLPHRGLGDAVDGWDLDGLRHVFCDSVINELDIGTL
jgi:hypothetical protein